MSLWQFTAFIDGFAAFHSPEKKANAPSNTEFEEFVQATKRAELIAMENQKQERLE